MHHFRSRQYSKTWAEREIAIGTFDIHIDTDLHLLRSRRIRAISKNPGFFRTSGNNGPSVEILELSTETRIRPPAMCLTSMQAQTSYNSRRFPAKVTWALSRSHRSAACLSLSMLGVLTETGSKLIELTGLRLRDSMRAGDASRRIQIHWHAQMHAHPILEVDPRGAFKCPKNRH